MATFAWLSRGLVIFLIIVGLVVSPSAWAGEGGSSTYTPGTNTWSMGVMPPPGLYFRYVFVFYEGRADAVVESGEIQLNARIRLMGNLLLPIVVTPVKILGGNWGILMRLPLMSPDLKARLGTAFGGAEIRDSRTGFGDIALAPFVLGWHHGNFHWMLVVPTIYFPTGEYSLSNSVNPGKNRYGLQYAANFTYLNNDLGLEAGLHLGYNTNFRNPATDYNSGDEFHLDYLLAYHTRFGLGLGVAGSICSRPPGIRGAAPPWEPTRVSPWAWARPSSISSSSGGSPVTSGSNTITNWPPGTAGRGISCGLFSISGPCLFKGPRLGEQEPVGENDFNQGIMSPMVFWPGGENGL